MGFQNASCFFKSLAKRLNPKYLEPGKSLNGYEVEISYCISKLKLNCEKYYVACQDPSDADQLCPWHFINFSLTLLVQSSCLEIESNKIILKWISVRFKLLSSFLADWESRQQTWTQEKEVFGQTGAPSRVSCLYFTSCCAFITVVPSNGIKSHERIQD